MRIQLPDPDTPKGVIAIVMAALAGFIATLLIVVVFITTLFEFGLVALIGWLLFFLVIFLLLTIRK